MCGIRRGWGENHVQHACDAMGLCFDLAPVATLLTLWINLYCCCWWCWWSWAIQLNLTRLSIVVSLCHLDNLVACETALLSDVVYRCHMNNCRRHHHHYCHRQHSYWYTQYKSVDKCSKWDCWARIYDLCCWVNWGLGRLEPIFGRIFDLFPKCYDCFLGRWHACMTIWALDLTQWMS